MNKFCVVIMLSVSCADILAQVPSTEADWQARDVALSHMQFCYDVTTTERRTFPTARPAQNVQVGSALVKIPKVSQPWSFTARSQISFRRDGEKLAVSGKRFSPNAETGKATALPILSFADTSWVGAYDEAPVNGNSEKGFIHIFGARNGGYTGIVPGTGLLVDGFFNIFLIGENPLRAFGLPWKCLVKPDGSKQFQAKNYVNPDTVVNPAAEPLAADFEVDVDPAGKILGGTKYVERNVYADGQPAHPIPRLAVQVTAWKKVAGYEIPSDIVWRLNLDITGRYPRGYSQFEWKLTSVGVSKGTVDPDFPKGAMAVDYRRDVKELEFAEKFSRDAEPQYYRWNGGLASEDQLDSLAKEHAPSANFSIWNLLSYAIPGLLVITGVWLMVKGGRKDRAQTGRR